MGEYEEQIVVSRAQRRKWGHAVGCAFAAEMLAIFILPLIMRRSSWIPILTLFVIVPLAAWAGYHWFEPARDWVVLQAYRLRGRF